MKIIFHPPYLIAFALGLCLLGCGVQPSDSPRDEPARTDRNETPTEAVPAAAQGDPREREMIGMPRVVVGSAAEIPLLAEASQIPMGKFEPRREVEEEPVVKSTDEPEKKEKPPEEPPPMPKGLTPFPKGSEVLFFEKGADDKRRVYILAEVCLREGQLEVFLCKKSTKEHESILRVDCDARDIHFALLAAKGVPGTTVKYVPEYVAATGTPIKITMTYNMNGKLRTDPAQYWIKDLKTNKEMKHDWVFAGSRFFKFPDEPNRQPYYCANNGEVISIANFPDSMLDLPVKSPREQADLAFEAWTDRIPPLKTKVLVTLEPVIVEKGKEKK